MARFGEVSVVDPETGRAFGDWLTYAHSDVMQRVHARYGLTPPSTLDDVAGGEPLTAHISEDRWVADCPDCGGADEVFEGSMILWCHFCGNAAVSGKPRRVILPDGAALLQEVLALRPMAMWRNWRNEPVDVLIAQNEERGHPTP